MKVLFLGLLFFSTLASANTQVLHCEETNSGPVTAEATLVIQLNPGNQSSVQMTYANSHFPQGIRGNFAAQYDAANQMLSGTGGLGPEGIRFDLTLNPNGNSLLVLTGDQSIHDYGFGADLICK